MTEATKKVAPLPETETSKLIKHLKTHPSYANSEFKPFSPESHHTNNPTFLVRHPDESLHFLKVLKSDRPDAHRRFVNSQLGHELRNLLGISGPQQQFVKGDHHLISSEYDRNLMPLVMHANPDELLKKAENLPEIELFNRLGFEDQHLGNAAIKGNKLQAHDLEYLRNPGKSNNLLGGFLPHSYISNFIEKQTKPYIINNSVLKNFTNKKEKILDLFKKHLPEAYDKDEQKAIIKHVEDTLNLYKEYADRLKAINFGDLLKAHNHRVLNISPPTPINPKDSLYVTKSES